MFEALHYEFMRNALAAGLLASLICGIMGTLVVVNRIVFLSGGIAHAAFGGIGLSFFLGWPYLVGTLGFCVAAAMVMAAVSLKAKHRADTIIGVIWAVGMAFGIIMLDLTPGYNVDLMSYLFGSILTVPGSDLWVMLVVGALIDEEFAQIRGVPIRALYFALIGILAVAIVLIIRIVGLILVIALLTIPPFMVEKYAKSLFQMMMGSSLLGAIFTISGLWLSYAFDLTSGASIILVAGIAFLLFFLIDHLLAARRQNSKQAPTASS
jgi:zinc transport system permease protein